MVVVFATIVVWIAVTVFWVVPKKMLPFEIIFLFLVDTVLELGTIAVLTANLKFIQLSPGMGNLIADLMFRLIELPLLLVTTSSLFLHASKTVKWGGVTAIIVFTLLVQKLLLWQGILRFHHWNLFFSLVYMLVFVSFSRAMTWVIMRASPRKAL
ncbi:hypothetical protein [Alicyclobacillus ferrooxydans]|uniref:Uncharacterized protein n=1 Tax=Alicyclobacillus ferrooxydans TaxID=471514 RepID=A0A0P9C7G3_9BACL|nr:hypothetical protein [Alicyclobacillus ferrooxydans]KPV40860.1 hypothetical protein AN477_21460 [Alicyclobacillus ferrooxydans]